MHRRVVFISAAVIVVLLANCQMQIANIESGAVALPNSQHTVAELFNMMIFPLTGGPPMPHIPCTLIHTQWSQTAEKMHKTHV